MLYLQLKLHLGVWSLDLICHHNETSITKLKSHSEMIIDVPCDQQVKTDNNT